MSGDTSGDKSGDMSADAADRATGARKLAHQLGAGAAYGLGVKPADRLPLTMTNLDDASSSVVEMMSPRSPSSPSSSPFRAAVHWAQCKKYSNHSQFGPFLAVSTLQVARIGSLFNIFRDLQDVHSFAPLQSQNLQIFCRFL